MSRNAFFSYLQNDTTGSMSLPVYLYKGWEKWRGLICFCSILKCLDSAYFWNWWWFCETIANISLTNENPSFPSKFVLAPSHFDHTYLIKCGSWLFEVALPDQNRRHITGMMTFGIQWYGRAWNSGWILDNISPISSDIIRRNAIATWLFIRSIVSAGM